MAAMTSTDQHRNRPSSTLFHTSTCQSPTTRGTSQGWRARQRGWPARCGVEGRGRCPGSGEECTRWSSPVGPSPSPATGGKEITINYKLNNWLLGSSVLVSNPPGTDDWVLSIDLARWVFRDRNIEIPDNYPSEWRTEVTMSVKSTQSQR